MLRRRGQDPIPGFEEDIHPGVWNRHQMWGAPHKWSKAWLALCGYLFAYTLFYLPWHLLVVIGVVWVLGQRGMVLLTRWDPHWDDVFLASFKYRRYKKRYHAG